MSVRMKIRYRFECSDEVSVIEVYGTNDMSTLIKAILNNIFGDKTPSCHLIATNTTEVTEEKVIVFKRTYKKKFEQKKKPVKKKRRKRWVSPKVIVKKRRWKENKNTIKY